MPRKVRTEAKAIKRIRDARTKAIVGWLYRWNEGGEFPMWKDGPKSDVIYE